MMTNVRIALAADDHMPPESKTARMTRVGVSWLRQTCASNLRQLEQPLEICYYTEPLAVIVPYELYLKWQRGWIDEAFIGMESEP